MRYRNLQIILLLGIGSAVQAFLPCAAVRGEERDESAKSAALSVPDFLARKKEWSNWARLRLSVRIEGRLGAYAPRLIRLQKCPVRFVPGGDREFPVLSRRVRHIELTGTLQRREDGQFECVVANVKVLPDDDERLRLRRSLLPRDDPQPWYRTAEWAWKRGLFYGDKKLQAAAGELRREGLSIERRQLKPDDIDGRFLLARKMERWDPASPVVWELKHEGFYLQWLSSRRGGPPPTAELLAALARELPGSQTLLKKWPATLFDRYLQQPLGVYVESNAGQRQVLHRLFYVRIVLEEIEQRAKPDGSNGFLIAGLIEQKIPELREKAEEYRQRELKWRSARVERASRSEVLELVSLYRKRNKPEEAQKVQKRWLTARQRSAERLSGVALIQLADDFRLWLQDDRQAAVLLQKAWKKLPNSPEIIQRMNALGYELRKGQWQVRGSSSHLPKKSEDRFAAAIREGRVLPEMTPAQVRRALAATPDSVIRVASNREINEVWLFVRPNNSRVAVHFRRHRDAPFSAARVVTVSQWKGDAAPAK